MKNIIISIFVCSLIMSCQKEGSQSKAPTTTELIKNPVMKVNYPDTRQGEVKDDYHGTTIADPYRWLEIDTAAEVGGWVKDQNKATFGYLTVMPLKNATKNCSTTLNFLLLFVQVIITFFIKMMDYKTSL